jgi:hypothetical protein
MATVFIWMSASSSTASTSNDPGAPFSLIRVKTSPATQPSFHGAWAQWCTCRRNTALTESTKSVAS